MNDNKNKLLLFEALELRAELDARIKTFKDCLPEAKQNRGRLSFGMNEEGVRRPSPDFDAASARQSLRKLEFKRRKLNNAIQQANFNHQIEFEGDPINLNEALEVRKALNEQIGELHQQVVSSVYLRVIYKEGRDIVEGNEVSYRECNEKLEQARLSFGKLNRLLRRSSFEITVDFLDE
ncbi:MAG: hypothetical protein HY787_29040 [Deltaproteobacteria bacterium]|nr:hypothetical protein [Deltaproteobacteria bacterium]